MPSIISVEKKDGIAVLTITKEPVNSMNLDFWQELLDTFDATEKDPAVRAVIIRSGLKKSVFTAGLDVNELYAPNSSQERFARFWGTLSKALTRIYASHLVTVAAIRGACPAGGCILALCCDIRVITEDGSLGLNEVQLGIPVPWLWTQLFASVAGHRQAEKMLQLGEMPGSSRLLELGMVDKVVGTSDDVLAAATEMVQQWLRFPDAGRIETKRFLRAPLAERWVAAIQQETDLVWKACSDPRTVAALGKVLERLSGGGKKTSKL